MLFGFVDRTSTDKPSAAELLGRQDVQQRLDALKRTHLAVVDEVVPGKLSLSMVHRVLHRVLHRMLQRLLRERVPSARAQVVLDAVDKICAYTSPTSALVLAPSGAAAPAIPLDPTLPVALGAGIPLAEAVAETALITAAGALWTALASAAYPGALA